MDSIAPQKKGRHATDSSSMISGMSGSVSPKGGNTPCPSPARINSPTAPIQQQAIHANATSTGSSHDVLSTPRLNRASDIVMSPNNQRGNSSVSLDHIEHVDSGNNSTVEPPNNLNGIIERWESRPVMRSGVSVPSDFLGSPRLEDFGYYFSREISGLDGSWFTLINLSVRHQEYITQEDIIGALYLTGVDYLDSKDINRVIFKMNMRISCGGIAVRFQVVHEEKSRRLFEFLESPGYWQRADYRNKQLFGSENKYKYIFLCKPLGPGGVLIASFLITFMLIPREKNRKSVFQLDHLVEDVNSRETKVWSLEDLIVGNQAEATEAYHVFHYVDLL